MEQGLPAGQLWLGVSTMGWSELLRREEMPLGGCWQMQSTQGWTQGCGGGGPAHTDHGIPVWTGGAWSCSFWVALGMLSQNHLPETVRPLCGPAVGS